MSTVRNFDNVEIKHGMLYIPRSSNQKTGDIPQVYSARTSCPVDCPMRAACYAAHGKCALVLARCDSPDDVRHVRTFGELRAQIAKSARRAQKIGARLLIRHGVSGDFARPGTNLIDRRYLLRLADCYAGAAYGYTHCIPCAANDRALDAALAADFPVSYSCETMQQADDVVARHQRAVLVWPADKPVPAKTPAGNRLVVCPAQTHDNVQCCTCRLCANKNRKTIIVFLAHGATKCAARAIEQQEKTRRKIIRIAAI